MKAIRFMQPEVIEYSDIPAPQVKDNEVLAKIAYAGFCATDIELLTGDMIHIKNGFTKYPIIPGHEWSGTIVAVGRDVRDLKVGDRITANYTAEDLSGKAADKTALQNLMGLNEEPNTPIIAMVSRLVSHKGLDLLREVMGDIMELPAQFVVLGSGDAGYEEFFRRTAERYPGRMAVRLGYNEALSMAIYAGADLFLMPSRSEPCGLSQMIAMRYGTVPIVRETGGLKDTVQPYEAWRDAGTGFTFANYSSADMLHVIREAVYLYKDYPDAFARLRDRAMAQDFSWNRSAGAYRRIYQDLSRRNH